MKIVLDTNVLVSGFVNANGNPAQIVSLVLSGAVTICYDDAIMAEYADVLARPRFKFDPGHVANILAQFRIDGIPIDASSITNLNLPDPDDEPFLGVSRASSSDFLVTGNLAHFPEDKRHGVAVLAPADFMMLWNSKPS
jgi:uncharacterized protein